MLPVKGCSGEGQQGWKVEGHAQLGTVCVSLRPTILVHSSCPKKVSRNNRGSFFTILKAEKFKFKARAGSVSSWLSYRDGASWLHPHTGPGVSLSGVCFLKALIPHLGGELIAS